MFVQKYKIKYVLLLLLMLNLSLLVFYLFFLKNWVIEAYQGKAPTWFMELLRYIYPRFFVEKYRFDLEFFLEKSQNVIWRFTLVNLAGLVFSYFYSYSQKFRNTVHNFWNKETTLSNVEILFRLYAVLGLWFTWDWIWDLLVYHKFRAFYEPVFLLKILGLGFPNEATLWSLYCVMLATLVLIFFQVRLTWTSGIFAVLFVFLQGYLFSFHKLDHTFAAYTYAVCLMPFLAYSKSRSLDKKLVKAWALTLIQVSITLTYFFAGLEKIMISGVEWFYPQVLATYLTTHQTDWGLWLAQKPILCVLLALATVAFELGFPLILFYKSLIIPILFSGLLFHLGTLVFLGVGGFPSPWVLTYVFFIDWKNTT